MTLRRAETLFWIGKSKKETFEFMSLGILNEYKALKIERLRFSIRKWKKFPHNLKQISLVCLRLSTFACVNILSKIDEIHCRTRPVLSHRHPIIHPSFLHLLNLKKIPNSSGRVEWGASLHRQKRPSLQLAGKRFKPTRKKGFGQDFIRTKFRGSGQRKVSLRLRELFSCF